MVGQSQAKLFASDYCRNEKKKKNHAIPVLQYPADLESNEAIKNQANVYLITGFSNGRPMAG